MTTTATNPAAALRPWVERAEHALEQVMPGQATPPETLHRAMRHAVFAGGKRLRPMLVYASANAVGRDHPGVDGPACAVELIHTYSLIHDDLPSMDDDDLRRGRPTCHVVYGEAMAILAGDALQALAFATLARDDSAAVDARTRLQMLQCLGSACDSGGMAGGQAMDLEAVGHCLELPALEHMHHCKTGALIRAAVRLGALAGGCKDARRMDTLDCFAECLGLAFQIRDDILDVESTSAALGKTVGKDACQCKPTFPQAIGLDASRRRLGELTQQALDATGDLGPRGESLRQLARFVTARSH